jgi:hypothetical protein
MKTPEGYEKDDIKKYLDSIGAYYFMPVQTGYGQTTVDILACIDGVFWGIEVKRPGKVATPRQEQKMREIREAGGVGIAGTAEQVIRFIKGWSAANQERTLTK